MTKIGWVLCRREKKTEIAGSCYPLTKCKYLGVSSDTAYRWIDKHGMPAHRVGRLWKFKKEQVDAWVEAGGAADRNKKGSDE